MPPGILALVPAAPDCRTLEGWNPHDLWCLRTTDVLHWDGAAWGHPIAIPLPAGNGSAGLRNSDAPFPNVLWVATTYGVARIHADGTSEDFTPPGYAGARSVVLAAVGGTVYLARDKSIFSLKNTTFVSTGADVIANDTIGGLAGSSDAGLWSWGYYGSSFVAHASGGIWSVAQPGTSLVAYNRAFAGHHLYSLTSDSMGHYCPDWCHVGTPPLHEPLVTPWAVAAIDEASGVSALKIDIPADVPTDGSVEYQASALRTTANGHLALLGCVTPRAGGQEQRYIVVHEWDGANLGAGRRLPPEVDCPNFYGNETKDALTDGTWVLPSRLPRGGFALVSP